MGALKKLKESKEKGRKRRLELGDKREEARNNPISIVVDFGIFKHSFI
jgi:hypothetical protein